MKITTTALGLLAACAAQAGIINLTFSGTVDTGGNSIFGLNGAAVPFSFQITYDTALDTNALFFPTGGALGPSTTTHPWYGYSASGVIATNVTFGTQTWTAANLSPRTPEAGITADLWFDTDLDVALPTLAWFTFGNSAGSVDIGRASGSIPFIFLDNNVEIEDNAESESTQAGSFSISATVPEPATLTLAGLGVLLFMARASFRRKPSRPTLD